MLLHTAHRTAWRPRLHVRRQMYFVLGVSSLYATFVFYDAYTSTDFAYSFEGQKYCAHTCDPYQTINVDPFAINASACTGTGTWVEGEGYTGQLVPFQMTCASGRAVATGGSPSAGALVNARRDSAARAMPCVPSRSSRYLKVPYPMV